MGIADHGGLSNTLMGHQSRFHFHGAQTVPGDIQHIIDAAHNPEIAVLVLTGTVAGQIIFAAKFRPVGIHITLLIAPDGAQHGRERFGNHQITALIGLGNTVAIFIHHVRCNAGQWNGAGAGLGGHYAGNGGDHIGAGFGLPPGVHNRAAFLADGFVIPDPGFRVNGLTHCAQQANTG